MGYAGWLRRVVPSASVTVRCRLRWMSWHPYRAPQPSPTTTPTRMSASRRRTPNSRPVSAVGPRSGRCPGVDHHHGVPGGPAQLRGGGRRRQALLGGLSRPHGRGSPSTAAQRAEARQRAAGGAWKPPLPVQGPTTPRDAAHATRTAAVRPRTAWCDPYCRGVAVRHRDARHELVRPRSAHGKGPDRIGRGLRRVDERWSGRRISRPSRAGRWADAGCPKVSPVSARNARCASAVAAGCG